MELIISFKECENAGESVGVEEAFGSCLKEFGIEVSHDVLRCPSCWNQGELLFCRKSWYHPDHSLH